MRRAQSSARAVFAAFCAAVLLAACAPPAADPSPTPPPFATRPAPASSPAATAPSAQPGQTGTAAPAPAPTPASEKWETFTTADGQFMFDHPAAWTIKDRAAEAAPGGVFVEVLSAAGKSLATLRTNMVTGSECTQKYPYSLIDSQELPALAQDGVVPRFVFEGRSNPAATDPAKTNELAYGITSGPAPSGPTACPIFHFFTWPPSGAMFGGTYSPFQMPPGYPPNVDTPEAYTETDEYEDVRAVIVSLRPAAK